MGCNNTAKIDQKKKIFIKNMYKNSIRKYYRFTKYIHTNSISDVTRPKFVKKNQPNGKSHYKISKPEPDLLTT